MYFEQASVKSGFIEGAELMRFSSRLIPMCKENNEKDNWALFCISNHWL